MYDSGEFERVLDAALAKVDWAGFPARQARSGAAGAASAGSAWRYYLEATGGAPTERAEIRFCR